MAHQRRKVRRKDIEMLSMLRHRNIALLLLGQCLSRMGDWMLVVGLPIYIYQRTGSTLATGATAIASTVPNILFGSVAGVVVDRTNRQWIMVSADLLRALTLPGILLGFTGTGLWPTYIVIIVVSALDVFFEPAKAALVPRLVRDEDLTRTNALLAACDSIADLLGPAIAGLLLSVAGLGLVLVLDIASFVISGLLIAAIRVPAVTGVDRSAHGAPRDYALPPGVHLWRAWREGFDLVRRQRVLSALFVVSGTVMLAQGIIAVLWVVFVTTVLQAGAQIYGLVQTAVAGGALLGGLAVPAIRKRLAPRSIISGGGICIGILLLATYQSRSSQHVLLLSVLLGLPAVVFFVTKQTLLQESLPDAFRGRVFGALGAVSSLFLLLGMGLASWLGDQFGSVPLLNIAGVLYVLMGVNSVWLLPMVPRSTQSDGPHLPTLSAPRAPSGDADD